MACIWHMLIMRLFDSLADKYGGKISEDERLDCPYEQLKEEHEYGKCKGHRHKTRPYKRIDSCENKYDTDQREYHNVARHDVCKKTYHQCHWFNEQ